MNAEQLAKAIDGREIGSEASDEECEAARASGLLIVYGASDDLMELRGVVDDEVGCYDGGTCYVDQNGLMPSWNDDEEKSKDDAAEYFRRAKQKAIQIDALWCASGKATWSFVTTANYVHRFNIMEDGERYCEGLVIDCSEL